MEGKRAEKIKGKVTWNESELNWSESSICTPASLTYVRPGNLFSVLFNQDWPSCPADSDTHFLLVVMNNDNLSLPGCCETFPPWFGIGTITSFKRKLLLAKSSRGDTSSRLSSLGKRQSSQRWHKLPTKPSPPCSHHLRLEALLPTTGGHIASYGSSNPQHHTTIALRQPTIWVTQKICS